MDILQIGYNCFAKDKYSLQIHLKRVTEIETHSKTLQVAKRDVWKKENIVDVTDKVQTPHKVQTVGDKVHTVSDHLQGAPCR